MCQKIVPAAALLAIAFSLSACALRTKEGKEFFGPEIVDFLVGDTPGEKETKAETEIEQLVSSLRMQPGFQVGKADGSAAAGGTASEFSIILYPDDRPGPYASPYYAEAVTRVLQRQPVFARNYRRGYLDGYRETYGADRGQNAYDAGRDSTRLLDGSFPDRLENGFPARHYLEALHELFDSDPEYERLFLQGQEDALQEFQKSSGGDGYSMGGPDGGGGGGG